MSIPIQIHIYKRNYERINYKAALFGIYYPVTKIVKEHEKYIDFDADKPITVELLKEKGIEINKKLVMIGFQYNMPDDDKRSGDCIHPSRIVLIYDGMGVVIPRSIRRALSGNRFKRNRLKDMDMLFENDKHKPKKIEEIDNKVNYDSTFIENRKEHIFKFIMSYNISGIKKILKKKFKEVDFASCGNSKSQSNSNNNNKNSRKSRRSSRKSVGGGTSPDGVRGVPPRTGKRGKSTSKRMGRKIKKTTKKIKK